MDIIDLLREFGIPIATGVIGYISGKPKEKADISTINVDNSGKLMDRWRQIADNEKQRAEDLEETISELKATISEFKVTITSLNSVILNMSDDNTACKYNLLQLQAEYDKLKIICNDLQLQLNKLKANENETSLDLNDDLHLN